MLISSNDLLGTAAISATCAAKHLADARERGQANPVERLKQAEHDLTNALAETRAALWGVTRRMPQYDPHDLDLVIDKEIEAIREAAGYIPTHDRVG